MPAQQNKIGMNNLVWFGNDLRSQDNTSLALACKSHGKVLAVYCLDPRQFEVGAYGFRKTEKFRVKFLLETLNELAVNLRQRNIPLFVYHATPEEVLPIFIQQHHVSHIFKQREWTSEETKISNQLKTQIPHCQWTESYDQFLRDPDDIPFDFDTIPEVFTNFRKVCETSAIVQPLTKVESQPDNNYMPTPAIPTLNDLGFEEFETNPKTAFPFLGGENQAAKRIQDYFWNTRSLATYKETRNGLIGTDYSSKLSAWLANGSVSARTVYWNVKQFEQEVVKNDDTYWLLFELMWRDYFKFISLKHGNKIFKTDGIRAKQYSWKSDPKVFDSWKNGTTPEPFVNANMKELFQTGWMSNRGRQNVASYWAKQCEQDWRIGAAWFESWLIDYDVHSNYGNWNYASGIGNDPRDRMFNIQRQASIYDPDGHYQKLWNP